MNEGERAQIISVNEAQNPPLPHQVRAERTSATPMLLVTVTRPPCCWISRAWRRRDCAGRRARLTHDEQPALGELAPEPEERPLALVVKVVRQNGSSKWFVKMISSDLWHDYELSSRPAARLRDEDASIRIMRDEDQLSSTSRQEFVTETTRNR